MKVGISGTQDGATNKQLSMLKYFLENPTSIGSLIISTANFSYDKYPSYKGFYSKIELFTHGDCIGTDKQSHLLIQRIDKTIPIDIRPCNIIHKRAYCKGARTVFHAKNPLVRNKDIVKISHFMFILPKGNLEELRSGTWSTYRYCKKIGKPHLIIYP